MNTLSQFHIGLRHPVTQLLWIPLVLALIMGQAYSQDTPSDGQNALVLNTAIPKPPEPEPPKAITFTPGLRIQTRYEYDEQDDNNDFYINRLRLKGRGEIFQHGTYAFEVKIDNEGRFNRIPRAQVENAWMNFPLVGDLNLCAGLFDMVYSRSALTSDSKLLLMDRTLMKDALTVLGLADNTIGLFLHGRPFGRHLSYALGVFDNLGFETLGAENTGTVTRKADGTMFTSRLAVDLLDPPANRVGPSGFGDYWSSYIGQGKRLTIAGNLAYLSHAEIGDQIFSLFAWGGDLFFNTGPLTVEAEYNLYREHFTDPDKNGQLRPDFNGSGWNIQSGFLFLPKWELAIRYQEVDANHILAADKLRWTSIGLNTYIRGHSLKVQTEYTFKREEKASQVDNDLFRVQLQMDF